MKLALYIDVYAVANLILDEHEAYGFDEDGWSVGPKRASVKGGGSRVEVDVDRRRVWVSDPYGMKIGVYLPQVAAERLHTRICALPFPPRPKEDE